MQRPYVAAEARTRNRAVAALPLSKFQPYALSVCQRASDQRERVFTHARKRGFSAARSPPTPTSVALESRAVYGLAYENAFWRDIVPRDVAGA